MVSATPVISAIVTVLASAVVFSIPTTSLPYGGRARRRACGQTTVRNVAKGRRPRERAASI